MYTFHYQPSHHKMGLDIFNASDIVQLRCYPKICWHFNLYMNRLGKNQYTNL